MLSGAITQAAMCANEGAVDQFLHEPLLPDLEALPPRQYFEALCFDCLNHLWRVGSQRLPHPHRD
jgi:hypothetical protein